MSRGVILYGPPASGKDTITDALTQLDPTYQLFHRLKIGPGRQSGYRMTTANHLDELRAAHEVIWENDRYGATYVVDREGLSSALSNSWPVVHLGQPAAPAAICAATPAASWLIVSLWCPRDVAALRLQKRGTPDLPDRLTAWDSTKRLAFRHIEIDTSSLNPHEAATLIHARYAKECRTKWS